MIEPANKYMSSYECPAGSCIVFTESLCTPHRRSCRLRHLTKGGADHAAVDWDNEEVDRCSIFNCYNSLWAQWHKTNLSHDQIMEMPPRRRSLFRGVYAHDFSGGGDNIEYSDENRAW